MGKYFTVKATAACVVYNEARTHILLTKRNIEPFKDHWCVPGGHIDKFESCKTAADREVKEETGLDFDGEFAFYSEEIIPEMEWHAVALVFTGVGTGTAQAEEAEVKEMAWFTVEEALELDLAFKHREILKQL